MIVGNEDLFLPILRIIQRRLILSRDDDFYLPQFPLGGEGRFSPFEPPIAGQICPLSLVTQAYSAFTNLYPV